MQIEKITITKNSGLNFVDVDGCLTIIKHSAAWHDCEILKSVHDHVLSRTISGVQTHLISHRSFVGFFVCFKFFISIS